MNLFKIFIPKDKAQEVTELESYTVTWKVLEGWHNAKIIYHEVFIYKDDAEEFKKQLEESAKFIKAYISVSISKI